MADLNVVGASDPPETIPIRDGEDFDQAQLAAYLRGKLPYSERPLAVVQFAGGHANLTYLLRYGDVEYVLRRPPLGPVAPSSHDMGREYRVLSVLYKAYPLAPRAYVYCEDPAIVGAPFFVMERRRGTVVRRAIPPQWGGGTDAAVNRKNPSTASSTCMKSMRFSPLPRIVNSRCPSMTARIHRVVILRGGSYGPYAPKKRTFR